MHELHDVKYLKVMADYGTDGLWDVEGRPLNSDDINALPLPHWLKLQLAEWAAMYETNRDYLPVTDPQYVKFDYVTFDVQGRAIAQKIKQYCPDYVVKFFVEANCDTVDIE